MNGKMLGCAILIILVLSLCFPFNGQTSGTVNEERAPEHETAPWYRGFNLWKTINLAVLVIFLVYLLGLPIKKMMAQRSHTIEQELMTAEQQQREMRRELETMKQRFDSVKSEIEHILVQGRVEADRAIENIEQVTDETVIQLKSRIQEELYRHKSEATGELLSYIVTEAIKLARQSIVKMDLNELQTHFLQKFHETMKTQGNNGERS
ncbi:ATP synthase F0 subunit B [bacterium]|nr:ATP synthase F0 subunit B [bacterium]